MTFEDQNKSECIGFRVRPRSESNQLLHTGRGEPGVQDLEMRLLKVSNHKLSHSTCVVRLEEEKAEKPRLFIGLIWESHARRSGGSSPLSPALADRRGGGRS